MKKNRSYQVEEWELTIGSLKQVLVNTIIHPLHLEKRLINKLNNFMEMIMSLGYHKREFHSLKFKIVVEMAQNILLGRQVMTQTRIKKGLFRSPLIMKSSLMFRWKICLLAHLEMKVLVMFWINKRTVQNLTSQLFRMILLLL